MKIPIHQCLEKWATLINEIRNEWSEKQDELRESQVETVHLYETAIAGVKGYPDSVLGQVEVNGK